VAADFWLWENWMLEENREFRCLTRLSREARCSACLVAQMIQQG
jgi:hypothetical protein